MFQTLWSSSSPTRLIEWSTMSLTNFLVVFVVECFLVSKQSPSSLLFRIHRWDSVDWWLNEFRSDSKHWNTNLKQSSSIDWIVWNEVINKLITFTQPYFTDQCLIESVKSIKWFDSTKEKKLIEKLDQKKNETCFEDLN